MDLPELPLRALGWLLRALLWLAWEGLFNTVGWYVGWCVCRTLSLGYFPHYGLRDEDKVSWPMRLVVELLGLGTLTALAWAAFA